MTTRPLASDRAVGIVGAGTMGRGIAQVAATAGHDVLLYDTDPSAVDAAIDEVRRRLERDVERGRTSATDAEAVRRRITASSDLADFAPVGLVIESIVEDLATKQAVLALVESIVPTDALITTNTSSLSVTALAAALADPTRLAGFHFFNPAPLLRLVEIISGRATDPEVAERCAATALAWGKTPVRCASTPGFIVNRVARPFYGEALRLVAEGAADVASIDRVVEAAGRFRMGPFTLMDLVGLDVNLAVSTSVYEQTFHDRRFSPSVIQRDLVDAGRLGRKTGAGFYDYRSSERPAPAVVEPSGIDGPIEVRGDLGWAGALVDRWTDAGAPVEFAAAEGTGTISVGGVIIVPTQGSTAGQIEAGGAFDAPVVVLDLFRPDATGVALAAATSTAPRALPVAAGALDAAGLTAIRVEDVPGLVLMRIVAQLASVAADAASEGVATPGDIDIAMRLGTNYPAGPLEWADELGVSVVVEVLDAMYDYYRDERYGAAGSLRRAALEGRTIRGGGRES